MSTTGWTSLTLRELEFLCRTRSELEKLNTKTKLEKKKEKSIMFKRSEWDRVRNRDPDRLKSTALPPAVDAGVLPLEREREGEKMTTIRRFCCNDLLRFANVNLDHLTETVSFLMLSSAVDRCLNRSWLGLTCGN